MRVRSCWTHTSPRGRAPIAEEGQLGVLLGIRYEKLVGAHQTLDTGSPTRDSSIVEGKRRLCGAMSGLQRELARMGGQPSWSSSALRESKATDVQRVNDTWCAF